MRFQAFVFDFDGVLANSVEVKTRAFGELYRPHGDAVAEAVIRYHRENGGMPRREKFRHWESELLGTPASDARLDELSTLFSALVVDNVVATDEIAGATEFLTFWHNKLPLFVDSATPDEELAEILKQRGLDVFFKAVYGSNRSKTDNLTAIIEENDFDPTTVLFFGDALGDLKAARACNAAFVGMHSTAHSPLCATEGIDCYDDFYTIQTALDEGKI